MQTLNLLDNKHQTAAVDFKFVRTFEKAYWKFYPRTEDQLIMTAFVLPCLVS